MPNTLQQQRQQLHQQQQQQLQHQLQHADDADDNSVESVALYEKDPCPQRLEP